MSDRLLEWIESTGWLKSEQATIQVPPHVIKSLYQDYKKSLQYLAIMCGNSDDIEKVDSCAYDAETPEVCEKCWQTWLEANREV